MSISVVIAAGGTGGHLIPALAVADAIKRARADATVAFVGTSRALDRELIPAAGYRLHATSVQPFTRGARGVLAPLSLLPATTQARKILRREKASVVLGMGGYASVPVIAAARFASIPSVVHEANAVPGLANVLCARITPNVAVTFADAARGFGKSTPRLVGMPLRSAIAGFDRQALRDEALRALGLAAGRTTVLVFGGSLGAARLNRAASELAERWRARADVQLLILAGRAHAAALSESLAGSSARVLPFLDRMELAYAAADVAVTRAGASTIAELAATGVPAVLVPYPHARRGEQDANARAYASAGAAVVVDDGSVDGVRLAGSLDEIFADRARLVAMGTAARAQARPEAAADMAAWVLALAEAPRG